MDLSFTDIFSLVKNFPLQVKMSGRSPRRRGDTVTIKCSVNPNININVAYGNSIYDINAEKKDFSRREFSDLKKWFENSSPWVSLSTENGRIDFFEYSIVYISGRSTTTVTFPRDVIGRIISAINVAFETNRPQETEIDI